MEPPTAAAPRGWVVARYVLGVVLGLGALTLLLSQRGELRDATRHLEHARAIELVVAVGAEALSLGAYAGLQRAVLAASGTRLARGPLYAITLANDALALSVPGEPVVSSAYRYAQYRRRGASAAGAGWAIVTAMVAQAVGLSLVLLAGLLSGAASGGGRLGVAIVGVVLVVAAGAVLVRRDALARALGALVRASRRLSGHPRGDRLASVERVLADVRAIRVERRQIAAFVAWAVAAWLLDGACLAASFVAVRDAVPWSALAVAYAVAQIVAVLPLAPGGLGLVEGSLTVVLVAYGVSRAAAVPAVLVYRLVAYWGAIVVGWLSVGGISLAARRSLRRTGAPPSSEGSDTRSRTTHVEDPRS